MKIFGSLPTKRYAVSGLQPAASSLDESRIEIEIS